MNCNLCGTNATNVCGKCGITNYCSRACQALDWNYHKQYCNVELCVKFEEVPEIFRKQFMDDEKNKNSMFSKLQHYNVTTLHANDINKLVDDPGHWRNIIFKETDNVPDVIKKQIKTPGKTIIVNMKYKGETDIIIYHINNNW